MIWKINGYIITNQLAIGESEIVLGVHETQPNMFMTGECKKDAGNKGKYECSWEHYFSDMLDAKRDFCERGLSMVNFYEQSRKKPKEKEPER